MLFFLSCSTPTIDTANEESSYFSITAEVSTQIPSVVTLHAESEYEGTIIAQTEVNGTLLQTKPIFIPQNGTVSFPFLGLPEQSSVTLSIEFLGEKNARTNLSVTTGSFLIPAPSIDVLSYTEENLGYMMGTVFSGEERLVIINSAGQIVWQTQQYDDDRGGIDSRIARDGQSIYFNRFSKDKSIDAGAIQQVQWDGTTIQIIPTPLGHHVFTELPDGTLTYIALDTRDTELYGPVCGDAIIEIAPDGTRTEIFTTWGIIPLYESDFFLSEFYGQGHDWTHTNFVEYFEETDRYLISMASTNMILELDRDGNVYKTIGGKGARGFDYSVVPPSDIFAYPHSPQWNHQGELLLMSTVGNQSEVLSYAIDEESKTLTKTWGHGTDYNYNVRHLGELSQNEQYGFVNWGTSGHIEILDSENNIIWEIFSPFGSWFAQFNHLSELPGMEPPQ